jgi:hypothetical protein
VADEDATTEEDVAEEEDSFSAAGAAGAASSLLRGKMLAKSEAKVERGRSDFTEVGVSPERTQPVMSVRALGQVTFSQSTSGLWVL